MTQFAGSQEVLQTNRFNTANLQHLVDDNTCTYLKTPAGIITEVTLPVVKMTAAGDSINSAKIIFNSYNDNNSSQFQFGTPKELLMVRKSEMDSFFEKNKLTDNVTSFYTTFNSTYNSYEYSNIARLIIHCENERQEWMTANMEQYATAEEAMEAYEAQFPDWNKVVLVPVKTIKDSNKNIVNYRHDLSLNSTRLVGGEDAILIKVITSAFNQ